MRNLLAHILRLIGAAIDRFAPDAVVVACNTASTIALADLRASYALPFIGCVPPVKPAAAASRSKNIGVLATAATVRRAYLADLVQKYAADCTVHTLGTPALAELAERKFVGKAVDPAASVAPLFTRPGERKSTLWRWAAPITPSCFPSSRPLTRRSPGSTRRCRWRGRRWL